MDYTKLEDVKAALNETRSEDDWTRVCDAVKQANDGGYPAWWFQEIILSGFGDRMMGKWGGSTQIRIEPLTLDEFVDALLDM